MKKKIFVVAAVIISSQLQAQRIPVVREDTATLDQVILTANKFEQKQSQTGKVVIVISKEQLEKSAGKTVAQVLNEQAGIYHCRCLQRYRKRSDCFYERLILRTNIDTTGWHSR
ncbi:MAG: hypothetical protein WDO16_18885 [Bacteroidota bacterium]